MTAHINDLEKKVAQYYSGKLLASVKYGESAVCVWFPGSGKSTIVENLLKSKDLLKKALGELYPRTVFVYVRCDATFTGKAEEAVKLVAKEFGVDKDNFETKVQQLVNLGHEVAIFLNSPDLLPEQEFRKLLIYLTRIVSLSPHRIHLVININNKPLLEKLILDSPAIGSIFQSVFYMPIISGDLLSQCFDYFESLFHSDLSIRVRERTRKTTGGIFKLTKEYFRTGGSEGEINSKLWLVWKRVPLPYREVILKQARKEKIKGELEGRYARELGNMGINGRDFLIFQEKYGQLESDPIRNIERVLSFKEKDLFAFFQKNKNKLIPKDQVAFIIWGQNWEEKYSDWAVDQYISRFRRKVARFGMGSEVLETFKGRGYKWHV